MPCCSQTWDLCNSCSGPSFCKKKQFLTSIHRALPHRLPGSCAGRSLAATHLPIGMNTSHLPQSLSKHCMDLCDLSRAAPVQNSNTWLCRWGKTGSFYHYLIQQPGSESSFACPRSHSKKCDIHRQTEMRDRGRKRKGKALLKRSAGQNSLGTQERFAQSATK